MTIVPLLMLPLSLLRRSPTLTTHTTTHFSNPIFFHPSSSSSSLNSSTRFPNKAIVFRRVNPSDSKDPLFSDENNAVVDDMDGYLNRLSLEYDSVWDTKPSWCQPWTITLTGVSIIAISWLILHSMIITSAISLLICAWWYIFLYSYPKGEGNQRYYHKLLMFYLVIAFENVIRNLKTYSEMIAERREKVTNGVEDTFGRRQDQ